MTVRLLVTSSSANLLLSAYQPTRILIATYINPDRALRDQVRFCTVLQLRSDQPQHILATPKKLKARGIVDISLSFVETFLSIRLDNIKLPLFRQSHQSILLAPRSVASVRLQEAPVDEFEVCFKRARRLLFTPWPERKSKDDGKKHADDTQSNRKFVKRVTRNKG